VDVTVTAPDGGVVTRPAFCDEAGTWHVRFRTDTPGRYSLRVGDRQLDHDVTASEPASPLPQRIRRERQRLVDEAGTPWLWLADTWWFALCDRVGVDELAELARQRVEQGYNTVHVVAGLLPEVAAYEDLGELAGRWAWKPDWTEPDPTWWAAADERIELIVRSGLLPVIVGAWSYYLLDVGVPRMTRHWREVIARWGAHPVVWCIAGEAGLPHYAEIGTPEGDRHSRELIAGWQEVGTALTALDAYHSVRTIHPFPLRGLSSAQAVDDPSSSLDLIWMQTGHSGTWDIEPTLAELERQVGADHGLPVINSEVCYEGILGGSEASLQRYLCYAHLLRGAAGHSYGAQGLWAFRRAEDRGPGLPWGGATWQEAAALPGGAQVGLAGRLLRELGWDRLRPADASARPQATTGRRGLPYVARSADTVVAYIPAAALRGPFGWSRLEIDGIDSSWRAELIDPRTGDHHAVDPAFTELADDGTWTIRETAMRTREDWLLVLRKP